ncbi:MAG: hypothetical protein E6R07_05230 [Nevskiaceae bacterium]|nr:MAG: hypothetical protein E6R07_05230 [Nevskiaceae bacterium]
MKPKKILLVAAMLIPTAVYAGPYANDLGKCLVDSTTKTDRESLVRWMFASASTHPAVSAIAKVSPEDLDKANAAAGTLFMKLMTESCRAQAKAAIQYEGPATVEMGFQILGQVAGREIFSSPEVIKSLSGLEKYMDKKKLEELKN